MAIKRINQINSVLVARRTLRELKLLRHFQGHPNIISIQDLFLMNKTPSFDEIFITQDLMDADLCHMIQSKYSIGEEHCQRFMYQILRGLKAMHSANVIHRDLKPGNLLWKHNGELRICDFGLARSILEPIDGKDVSMTNYVATRWYRPPEILLYRANYGKPLDIWSVGCIFAELLGRRVFLPGQSGFEQLHLILQKLGTPEDSIIDNIPSAKSRDYLRRLPRYPAYPLGKRFPNASPLAIDLLGMMLQFDPERRVTAEEALAHPYFARYHNVDNEPTFGTFDFSFDEQCITLADIKARIMEEVGLYAAVERSPAVVHAAAVEEECSRGGPGRMAISRDDCLMTLGSYSINHGAALVPGRRNTVHAEAALPAVHHRTLSRHAAGSREGVVDIINGSVKALALTLAKDGDDDEGSLLELGHRHGAHSKGALKDDRRDDMMFTIPPPPALQSNYRNKSA